METIDEVAGRILALRAIERALKELPSLDTQPLSPDPAGRFGCVTPSATQFSMWQFETLLDQSLSVLERYSRERSIFDDLRARSVETNSEYIGQLEELKIQMERLGANQHLFQKQAADSEVAAHDAKFTNDPATWAEIQRCLSEASSFAQRNDDGYGHHIAAAQLYTLQKDLGSNANMRAALVARASLADADATRFSQTVLYLAKVLTVKTDALVPGGALDFTGRFTAMRAQLETDLRDAYLRVVAAREGMKTVLGYRDRFAQGGESEETFVTDDKIDANALMVWVRRAISWLVALSHKQEAFTQSASLRALLKPGDWINFVKALKSGQTGTVYFTWPEDYYSSYAGIRMRAVAAYTLGTANDNVFRAVVKFPEEGRITLAANPAATSVMGQPNAHVILGRVSGIDSIRDPELVTGPAILNRSPFGVSEGGGKIALTVHPVTPIQPEKVPFEDLVLELQLVGLPKVAS